MSSLSANFEALRSWLESQGGSLHSSLAFRDDTLTGPGLFADSDLESNACAIRVPVKAFITPAAARAGAAQMLGSSSAEEAKTFSDKEGMALYLVLGRLAEEGSQPDLQTCPHAAYIKILPRLLHLPSLFSDAELGLLSGTPLLGHVQTGCLRVQEVSKKALEWAKAKGLTGWESQERSDRWTNLWTWAEACYTSRAFPPQLAGLPLDSAPVLIPGLDAFNHARGTRVTWKTVPLASDTGTAAVELILHDGVAQGSQAFNSYGAKSNEEFLASYGFVDSLAADEALSLKVGSAASSSGEVKTRYWLHSSPAPPVLLQDIAALLRAQGSLDAEVPDAGSREELEHQGVVLEVLEEMLCEKRKVFKKSSKALDYGGEGVRPVVGQMVRIYRDGQLRLLNEAIDWTRAEMDELSDKMEAHDTSNME